MTSTVRVQRVAPEGRRRPSSRARLLLAAGGLLLLAAGLALAVIVRGHPAPLPGDVGLEVGLQHLLLPHKGITAVIDAVSTINWPVPSAIALAVIVVLLLVLRRWLDALVILVVAGLADGSSYLTNQIVRRPRPLGHGIHVLQHITNYYSFPSGHVIHALAVFGILVFLTYQTRRPLPWLWPVRLVLLVLIVLMGPSRMLEGEHWPSDVLEGLLYGALWLIVGIGLYDGLAQRFPCLRPASADAR